MTLQEILERIENVLYQGVDTDMQDLDLLRHDIENEIIEGENKYARIYYQLTWDGTQYVQYYYAYLGKHTRTFADRYYYVVLNKDYKGHGPLSSGRVTYGNRSAQNRIEPTYKTEGAKAFWEGKKFPKDDHGYYIPQDYLDEFGYE